MLTHLRNRTVRGIRQMRRKRTRTRMCRPGPRSLSNPHHLSLLLHLRPLVLLLFLQSLSNLGRRNLVHLPQCRRQLPRGHRSPPAPAPRRRRLLRRRSISPTRDRRAGSRSPTRTRQDGPLELVVLEDRRRRRRRRRATPLPDLARPGYQPVHHPVLPRHINI